METPLSISHLEPSYIAITGSVKGGEGSVMTVWDTEFGTLQTSKPITSMLQQNVSGSKSHISVQSSSSTLTGPVVVITEVAIVSGAGSLLDFSVSCGLLPYHGNKVTLLSALGKGVERGASSTFNTVAPVNADSVAVTDLCNPSKSQEEFEASFEAWILSKASCTSAVTLLSSNDTDAAEDVAYVQIEHSHLSALILRILGSDFSKSPSFYPRSALKYLVKSGRLSATIQTTQRSPSTMNGTLYAPSTSLSLVRQVLDRNDMEMLELVLRNVPDIDEADMVAVLKYVSLAGDATSPLLPAIVAERRNALDKFVIPSDCDITTTTTVAAVTTTTTTSASSSLSPAQLFFITRIFSIPRNDHFFVRALREQMNIEHVECMFSWIDECFSMAVSGQKQVLSVEEVKPLSQWWWYAWTEPGAKSKKAKHNNNAVANVSDGNGAARTAFEVVKDKRESVCMRAKGYRLD